MPTPNSREAKIEQTSPVLLDSAAQTREAEITEHVAQFKQDETTKGEDKPPEEEKFVTIAEAASRGRDGLREALAKRQKQIADEPKYTPPPRTERQMSALEAEMDAGRRANARHAAQQAARPAPPADKTEGSVTPVKVDGTHVPKFKIP